MTQVSKDFLEYFSEVYETTEDKFTLTISEVFKVNGSVKVVENVSTYELNNKLPVSFKEKFLTLSKIPILNKSLNPKKILNNIKGYENVVTSLDIYNKYLKNTTLNILIDESYEDKLLVYNKSKIIINDSKYYFDENNYNVIVLK
jgi:hypothetical protein